MRREPYGRSKILNKVFDGEDTSEKTERIRLNPRGRRRGTRTMSQIVFQATPNRVCSYRIDMTLEDLLPPTYRVISRH